MGEADDAAEWLRIMAERCRWKSDHNQAEAEALGPDGRAKVQYLFEQIFFEGLLNYRFADDGNALDGD